jgi:predicted aspartyl protease
MFGYVDQNNRPILRVTFRHPQSNAFFDTDTIVDTGCHFAAILTSTQFAALALPFSHSMKARLSDGSTFRFRLYHATIDWFGHRRPILVSESKIQMPLLGAELFNPHILIIDYAQRTVEIR